MQIPVLVALSLSMSSPCLLEFALSWVRQFKKSSTQLWNPSDLSIERFANLQRLRQHAWSNQLTLCKERSTSFLHLRSKTMADQVSAILSDLLIADPLTRVVAASARSIFALDRREKITPVLHDSFLNHREVRCQALELLMHFIDRGYVWARSLNRLRSFLEEWTDWLLGYLAAESLIPPTSLVPYGFSRNRILEIAYELQSPSNPLPPHWENWFRIQGIRRSLRSFPYLPPLFPDWDLELRNTAFSLLRSTPSLENQLSYELDRQLNRVEALLAMQEL